LVRCYEQVANDYQHGSQRRSVCPDRYLRPVSNPILEAIKLLEPYCSEFLIHAADNEGLQKGIDEKLVERLAQWCSLPVTYAGGGRTLEDLDRVKELSNGKVDLTIGSALDCFGGSGVKFDDCVEWNKKFSSS
jgi:phosphoribosylformimino-5-aminoimidazole carboxamide ribotide isomerase